MTIENKGPGGVGNSYGQRVPIAPTKIAQAGIPNKVYNEFDATPGVVKAPSGGLSSAGVAFGFNSKGLSGTTYDGSNRCTGFTLEGIIYTITGWGTSSITISGNNGSSIVVTLDGSGRIQGVS